MFMFMLGLTKCRTNRPFILKPADMSSRFAANPVGVRCHLLGNLPYLQLEVFNLRGEAIHIRLKSMGVASSVSLSLSFGDAQRCLDTRILMRELEDTLKSAISDSRNIIRTQR